MSDVSLRASPDRLSHEGRRPGPRDGAQVFHQVVAVHADAVVGDGDGLRRLVHGDGDAVVGIAGGQLRRGQRIVAQPVAGVGCVGDQLAQEDFLVAVQ